MARTSDIRAVVRLKSAAGTGYTYVTRKNRRNDPDRLEVKKYCPHCNLHQVHRETR